MKFTERISTVEFTYEGTPEEIMHLYNKINSNKSPNIDISPGVHCKMIKTNNELIDTFQRNISEKYNGCQNKSTRQGKVEDFTPLAKNKIYVMDFNSFEEKFKESVKKTVEDTMKRSLGDED